VTDTVAEKYEQAKKQAIKQDEQILLLESEASLIQASLVSKTEEPQRQHENSNVFEVIELEEQI